MESTLITASASRINLINGAQACNIFWQVGSSATLGTDSAFAGNILAKTSITLTTHAAVSGRALALNGAVTLDGNIIDVPQDCTVTAVPELTQCGGIAFGVLAGGFILFRRAKPIAQ